MDFNILDQPFIDHVKSAHVVIQRMAPYNMDLNVPFLNNKENYLHLTSLGETKYATKYFVEKLYSKINWNGFNEKFIEHMISAYVVMDCFKCKECDAVFHNMREYYLHLASHVQRTDGDVSNDRFVKLYSCDKCDKKFVQKSTLDMHMAFHDPFPHNCDCGIGFYLKSDLLMHKELVHPTIFKAQFDKLTCRKQRALKNEYWGTAFEHRGPDAAGREKKEERTPVRSQPKGLRLRAEPVVKSKTKTKSKQPRQWKIKLKRGKHPCDVCGKEFSQRANLKRHARTHEPPTLGCPECGKMFRHEIELQVHQRTHSGERPYQCHLCRRRFTQSGALKLHLQRHAGLKPFACDVCGKRFLSRDALARHHRTHSGAKPYACSHCGKAFGDPSALRRHERTHSGVKPYACDFCGMRFSDASGRIAHEKRHMADRRHRCAACGKRFYSASELRKHHAAVHTPHRPFQCDLCSKSFALKQYVDIHIRDVHSGAVPPLRCDGCDFRTLFKSNLAIHMRRHMAMPKKYRCEDCGMRFYSRTPMERHRDAKHRRLHKFECDDCGARFTTKGELFRHVVNVHMDVRCDGCSKRFCSRSELERHRTKGCVQCDICRVKFPSNRRLNLHRPTHFAAKHPCPICFKMFKRVATLNRHYADVHSEEKNFECFYCGGKFALKSILRSHIYKEHVESMYCHICKREFYSDSDLKRHKSKGCKGKPLIPCEICDKLFKSSNGMRVHLLVKHAKKYVECDHCQSRFGVKSGLIRHIRGQHKHVIKTQHRP